jgi:hypothetical protein
MSETTNYRSVRPRLKNGDMLALDNPGLITWTTKGRASHIGSLCWRLADQNSLSVAESREGYGARVVSLSSQIRRFPGRISIYRPGTTCPIQVRERAATICYNWAGHEYNYPGIFYLGISNAPVIRYFAEKFFNYHVNYSDMTLSKWDDPKFCSQLYIWSYRLAFKELRLPITWDPVPGIGDKWVTPVHLRHSGAFSLLAPNLIL